MKLRAHVIKALLIKDWKLSYTNKNTFLMLCLPLFFIVLYTVILPLASDMPTGYVLVMCGVMNLAMGPLSLVSMVVAEEKEKNTLRTLMLSDVSALEFLISKMGVQLFLVMIIYILLFALSGVAWSYFLLYLLVSFLATISIMLLGASIGLLSKDQMSTSTLTVPLLVVLLIPSIFSGMSPLFQFIANLLPGTGFTEILMTYIQKGILFSPQLMLHYLVMLVWIVLGCCTFWFVYKKKGLD